MSEGDSYTAGFLMGLLWAFVAWVCFHGLRAIWNLWRGTAGPDFWEVGAVYMRKGGNPEVRFTIERIAEGYVEYRMMSHGRIKQPCSTMPCERFLANFEKVL